MNTTEQILVIFLSTFLALFLLFGIILTVKLIQLANRMKQISEKAQGIVDNVESASEILKKSAGPMAFGKLFMNLADVVKKHKGGK